MRSIRAGHQMTEDLTFTLKERALDTLQACTTMLDVALKLVKQGNLKEADRLRYEARAKRNESMLLIARANRINHSGNFAH